MDSQQTPASPSDSPQPQTDKEGTALSFQLWWGLLGCAALMVAILLAAPYGDTVHFLPDRGGAWYYWKLPDPNTVTRLSEFD